MKPQNSNSSDNKNPILADYSKMLEELPLGVCLLVDGKIIWVNKYIIEILGYSIEELQGNSLEKIIAVEYFPLFLEDFQNFSKKKNSEQSFSDIATKGIKKDGTSIDLKLRFKLLTSQNIQKKKEILVLIDKVNIQFEDNKILGISLKNFRYLTEETLIGICIIQSGKIKYINQKYADFVGYTADEILNWGSYEFLKTIHPDNREFVKNQNLLKQENRANVVDHYIYKGLKNNGEIYYIEVYGKSIEYGGGFADFVISIDVTERIETETALKLSESRHRMLVQRMNEGLFMFDNKDNITFVNNRLCKMLNYLPHELIGHTFQIIIDESFHKLARESIKIKQKNGIDSREILLVNKSKNRIPVLMSPQGFRDSDGIYAGGFATVTDITELKQTQRLLNNEKEKYQTLVEHMNEGLIVLDKDDQITYTNKKLNQLLKIPIYDLYNHNVLEFFDGEAEEILKKQLELNRNGIDEPYELNISVLSSPKKTYELNISVLISPKTLFDSKENYSGIFAVVTDISELKRVENEKLRLQKDLLKSQKLESISILAGGIAHDFNNVLTSILGNISLAQMELSGNKEMEEIFIEVENAISKAKSLVNQFLPFSKGGEPIKKLTRICEIIRENTNFILKEGNVRPNFKFKDILPAVEIDETQMSQVIRNLILNAKQAMPDGGIVNISGDICEISKDFSTFIQPGEYIKIEIQDFGIGIPKDDLQKIFDPYFTTKKEGHGLSLASSYSIIKKHGGYITVDSKVGLGTRFSIYLPTSKREMGLERSNSNNFKKGQGMILILDDEESIIRILSKMLERLNYTTVNVKNGKEAIRVFKEHYEKTKPFDAIIMDLTIPGEMGGKEAISMILKIDPNAKAIVSSGYSTDSIMANYKEYGFVGVLSKPYTIEELEKILNQVLSSKK